MNEVIQDFYEIAGMPCTIGAVDGTHILIKAPQDEEWNYVNRKGQHSINVQVNKYFSTSCIILITFYACGRP